MREGTAARGARVRDCGVSGRDVTGCMGMRSAGGEGCAPLMLLNKHVPPDKHTLLYQHIIIQTCITMHTCNTQKYIVFTNVCSFTIWF